MADYTTIDKVRALLREDVHIAETTIPKLSQVTAWITNVTNRINLALTDGGHTSPATDATQLSVLDLLNAKEVAWMVLFAKGSADEKHEYHAEFKAAMEALAAGELLTSGSTAGTPWSYTMDADTDDVTDPLGPSIRKDMSF